MPPGARRTPVAHRRALLPGPQVRRHPPRRPRAPRPHPAARRRARPLRRDWERVRHYVDRVDREGGGPEDLNSWAQTPATPPRRCPACGHTAKENRPTQDTFHCVSCGHRAHADTVGAVNVLRAGLVRRDTRKGQREAPGPAGEGVTRVCSRSSPRLRPACDSSGRP
ncbi:zinc ribbon domain-containing protein [Kitasatospora sp. NPDC001159]